MRINTHKDLPVGVQDSEADTLVQSTIYYASGVPMAQSFGRDKQPYLYNGKEFIEAHGLNEYDSQARMYYSPVMRTTTMDPMAEKYYHISPYAYAGNNFINAIDWMGLGAYTTSDQDKISQFLTYLAEGNSVNEFNPDGWIDITTEADELARFLGGFPEDNTFIFCTPGNGGILIEVYVVATSRTHEQAYTQAVYKGLTNINEDVLSFASAVVNLRATTQWNPFYWYGAKNQIYTRSQIHMRGGYANSFKQAGLRLKKSPLGKIGGFLGVINMGNIIYDMGKNGISAGNTVDLAMNLVGYYGPWGLLASAIYGVADWGVTTISGQSNSDWINYGVNYLIEEY